MGIRMGSVSLSSSTSKECNPILPHLAGPDYNHQKEDAYLTSPEPDLTFGNSRDPIADTQNTSGQLEESKDTTVDGLFLKKDQDSFTAEG